MKIRTKLSLTFLLVSILPMVIAVYLAIRVNINLLQSGIAKQLDRAGLEVERIEQQYLTRTGVIARMMVNNPKIIQAILDRDKQAFGDETHNIFIKVGYDEAVYIKPADLVAKYVPKGEKIALISNPIWQGFLPAEVEPERGLMAVTIYKIEHKGKLIGGIRVGNQFEKNIVQGIIDATGINAVSIFPKESPTSVKIATPQLRNRLFKLGQSSYSNDILISNLHYQALFLPLKGLNGEVIGVVFLGVPQQPVEELWNRYRNTFYLFTIAIGSLFAIIIAFLVAGNIAKPIRQLAQGAEQIAAGNLDLRIDVHSRDEVGELADAFNNMAARLLKNRQLEAQLRLKDKLAALGQLSSGMAHEVRNPLSSIKVSAELIQRKLPVDTQEFRQLQYIIDDVNRLNVLISDFLTFAKPREPNISRTNVEDIVQRTLALANSQIAAANQSYQIEWQNLTNSTHDVAVDANQIQQVFLNLVLNACQAMPNGGKLQIKTFQHPDKRLIGISFTDEGPGIPDELHSKIFEPFFTTKEKGTGLGLAISYQIIETHGGRIELKTPINRDNSGSTFTVYLPLAKD